jgi:hypothetical protein
MDAARGLWHHVGRPRPSFRPVLYLMLWGAALRLLLLRIDPLPIDTALGSESLYEVWLGLGMACPPLALLAWWLIRHRLGVWRYRGMWLRLSADIGMCTSVMAYHVTTVLSNPLTESRIYSRYIVGATILYIGALIVADVRALVSVERRARVRQP